MKRREFITLRGGRRTWHSSPIPCAAEIRTLLGVKRTSGDVVARGTGGWVRRPPRLTRSGSAARLCCHAPALPCD